MKTSIKTIAAVIALSALIAGPASAMVSQSEVTRGIQSALGADSNVTAFVQGDTVTLSGYFADAGARSMALQAALNAPGVEHVINNAFQSN